MLQITTAMWLSSLRCANDFPVGIRKIWKDAVTAFSCSCPYDTSLYYFDAEQTLTFSAQEQITRDLAFGDTSLNLDTYKDMHLPGPNLPPHEHGSLPGYQPSQD